MRDTKAATRRAADAPPNVWVFEDQLSPTIASLRAAPDARVFMVESRVAFCAWPFHKRRLSLLVSAMRHFADELRDVGRAVDYFPLRDDGYVDSIAAIRAQVDRSGSNVFVVMRPSEHHTQAWLDTLPARLGIELRYVDNDLFLTDRTEFAAWLARQGPRPVMETFYRRMRVEHRLLMDGERPCGGAWNLDKLNRRGARSVPRPLPEVPTFPPDAITLAAMRDVDRHFADHPGTTNGFAMPVSRGDADRAFADFLERRLPQFGEHEDAMLSGEPTLFHSEISLLLNLGLLSPLDACRAAENEYRVGRAPLNSVEGFVRQIVGWREYVHGIYHALMPGYRDRNAPRGSKRPLPDWFWTGDVEMNCLRHSIGGVVERGYAHHIQRLMVICNFATLAGLAPSEVNDWFYAMFVDAHDWVVTPNVVGMGLNADAAPGATDGTIATKPYVSSAAYIDRMSDYCGGCRFDPKVRTGENACPFNFLYWTFLHHFRPQLEANSRMKMPLANVDKIGPAEMRLMMLERKQFIQLHVDGRAYGAAPTPSGR